MSESGYEYECSRAELLGISPPSYDEYLKNVQEKKDESEEVEVEESVNEIEGSPGENEIPKTLTGGKLDEFNNIIQSTQEKLSRFKVSYGSLTNVLKSKLGKSLDISFSQSESNDPSQTVDTSCSNTDKNDELSIIGSGSITHDKDKETTSNRLKQNGQSVDFGYGATDGDYKEIELDNGQVKNTETKKFLNFGFLNLGGGK